MTGVQTCALPIYIRRWGTTDGLGELRTGPMPNTIVDEYGDVEGVPLFTISARGW